MGGSDPQFPHVLEANPHFPHSFKILTSRAFSKSSLSSHFQNPHFPRIFEILTFLTFLILTFQNPHFSSSQKLTHVT